MAISTPSALQARQRQTYADEPDFTRPPLDVPAPAKHRILERLNRLYAPEAAGLAMSEIVRLLRVHHAHKPDTLLEAEAVFEPAHRFDEADMVLITYADMIRSQERSPLAALAGFVNALHRRGPVFNTLHLLPFFPSSSDRGFSVTDFQGVDPAVGSWQEIRALGASFRLMFDGVFNHASAKSRPFREMLCGNPDYRGFAATFASPDDLRPEQRAMLRRPRTSDILTSFQSIDGPVWVWTTFSPDQIDLNFKNPKVLAHVVETLLFYVRQGANLVRLDAVTYLWDEPGTPGASLVQTHEIVKLLRDVLDVAAPHTALVTETNVPHAENVSYFGDGSDEAQMVYNFALPPLVLHAFYRQDASALSRWARGLVYPTPTTTYLNILDTHDGIGLAGAAGILPPEEIDALVARAREHGAFVSYHSEGSREVPYEINTTWYSALNMESCGEPRALQVKRLAASRSIALVLRGVPALYLHGLVGSRNDVHLALQTRTKRDVNRATLDEAYLLRRLAEPHSKLALIADSLGRLLETRVRHRAFHPNGAQRVIEASPAVFAVLRSSDANDEHILAVTNVTGAGHRLRLPMCEVGAGETHWYDLVGGRGHIARDGELTLDLQPYDVAWLVPYSELERTIESPA